MEIYGPGRELLYVILAMSSSVSPCDSKYLRLAEGIVGALSNSLSLGTHTDTPMLGVGLAARHLCERVVHTGCTHVWNRSIPLFLQVTP